MNIEKITINSKAYVPTALSLLKQGLHITTDIYDAYLTRPLDELNALLVGEIIHSLNEDRIEEKAYTVNTEGMEKKMKEHMREYISKEDTIKAMNKVIHEASTVREANIMFKIKSVIYSQDVIKFPPDVQIVKHGRWIPQGNDMWLCSNCKENIIISMSKSDRTEKQRYCCRCGARMDGERSK